MGNQPQVHQSPSPSEQLHSPNPMYKKTGFIGLVVLLALAVGIGGYFLGARQNQNKSSQSVPPSPASSDATADWKTYKNRKYGYQIKYPAKGFKKFSCAQGGYGVGEDRFNLLPTTQEALPSCSTGDTSFPITISLRKGNYVKETEEIYKKNPDSFRSEISRIDIDGIVGLKIRSSKIVSMQGPDEQIMILVFNKGWTYYVTLNNFITYEDTFNKMVSTFKFLNLEKAVNEKIVRSEVTYDCEIKVTTTADEFLLDTNYKLLDPQPKCYQFLLNQVSPNGDYVAYQDMRSLEGRVAGSLEDNIVKVYSLKYLDSARVTRSSSRNIFDMLFLPNGKLVVLHGLTGSSRIQHLSVYNFSEFFKNYLEYIADDSRHEKTIELPDVGKQYSSLFVSGEKLGIYPGGGINELPLIEYNLSEL